MEEQNHIVAYIDAANLHKGISSLGWKMDYARFRVFLSEKYGVGRAYMFIGLIPKYKDLYTELQEDGYTLVFKEVTYDGNGKPKGNCDADLVTQAMRDVYEGDASQVVLVTGDGDYASLVKFLIEKKRMRVILSPSLEKNCSVLLKRTNAPITYLNDKRKVLQKSK